MLNSVRKIFRLPFLEKTLHVFSKNRDINSFWGKMIPGNDLYPLKSLRRVKRNGINYSLDISDYQNWLIYFELKTDVPVGLYELIKKNDVMIDVGVNIGQTSMNVAKLCGSGGQIIGFEPDPVNYGAAMENLSLNSFKNIHYYNIGLGNQKAVLPLKINTVTNRGGNRIDVNSDETQSIQVEINTMDNLLPVHNLKKIDLIKIDVEGFELEVLKGSAQTISTFKPVLFIEVSDRNLKEQNTTASDLISYINNIGYKIWNAETNDVITSTTNLTNCHIDVICR